MDAASGSLSLLEAQRLYDSAARDPAAAALRVTAEPAGALPPRFRESWSDLAASAAEPNAFYESWFLEPSLRCLALPADLKILCVWQGLRLLGILPVHGAARYGRLPVRHLQNWTHFHCFLGTPLVRAGAEESFWSELLRFLDAADWAAGFLHLKALVEDGPVHRGLTAARRCDTVHRMERAFLMSDLSPDDYYERAVRKKKRKELKRLAARLAELGEVRVRTLSSAAEVEPWCEAFLALERSGWKGERGSALGCEAGTADFFREAVAGAFSAGRLDFLRLDLDGRPLAMLVNFLAPPGSFSFKIAIDEDFARFSPGVLIQLENLRVLGRGDIGWMDSCAAENHPMINSLWMERRPLVRVTVPLSGAARAATFSLCRFAEDTSATIRGLRR